MHKPALEAAASTFQPAGEQSRGGSEPTDQEEDGYEDVAEEDPWFLDVHPWHPAQGPEDAEWNNMVMTCCAFKAFFHITYCMHIEAILQLHH